MKKYKFPSSWSFTSFNGRKNCPPSWTRMNLLSIAKSMFIPHHNASNVINCKVQDNILGRFQLVVARAYSGDGMNSAKEANTYMIFCALKRAKELVYILKVQVLSNALEVVRALNGEDDWTIKGLIDDIYNFSSTFTLLVLIMCLEILIGSP